MKKLVSVTLLLMIILCAVFVSSCSNSSKNDEFNDKRTPTENEHSESTGEVSGDATLDIPEEVRFDGETFSLYIAHSTRKKEYISEGETGELLNDAIFNRNELTKERLGIDFNFVCSTLTTSGTDQAIERNKVSSLILAGDKTYDAYVNAQPLGIIEKGLYIDWNCLPYIDMSKPWWYANAIRDINFGNKIFYMTGDYNLGTLTTTACLAFNKTMLDELEMDYPYQLVFDGKWTHDEFIKYIQAAAKDLNGDGAMDYDNDRYGFAGWQYEQIPALFVGYGGEIIKKDDSNMPVLNIYSELQNTIIDKMIEVFALPGSFYHGKTFGIEDKMFTEGRLLFNDSFLASIPSMRNYEDEIGFIPYPKLNPEQENYYSRTGSISCLTYIPTTLTEDRFPLVGAVLETMAYYSNRDVLPIYFDIILDIQSTRDVESEQMIPIIRGSTRFVDRTMGYSVDGMVMAGQNTLASIWASGKSGYDEKLKQLIDVFN